MNRHLLIALLFFAGDLTADSLRGEIRFQPAREGTVWVGQELELQLDLMSTGFSFSGQQFSLPDVSGAYLLQADSSTVKLNESRGAEAWQGLRYSFLLYPQREGRLVIPAFEVRFSASAGFGQTAETFRFETEPLMIETQMPPGADRAGLLVTTTDFTMKAEWTPAQTAGETSQLKVGDALRLNITRRAAGVPGMVFSPLPDFEIDGLQDYHDPPRVNDQINRGELVGVRSDSLMFICEREGSFEIPALQFQWWDPAQEKLNEETISGLRIEVIPNPAFTSRATSASRPAFVSWTDILLAAPVLILLVFAGRRFARKVIQWIRQRRMAIQASEPWAFRQALRACSSAAAPEAYRALTLWLSRLEPASGHSTLLQLAQSSGNPELLQEVESLQTSVARGINSGWNGASLGSLLSEHRNSMNQKAGSRSKLPDLNPT